MSNAHWIPWLQAQLLKADIPTSTPEIPFSFDRNWNTWTHEVERFDMGPETILVGHSTGAGFFIKYLSIHTNITVNKMILVAPWLDPEHELSTDFFDDFEIDSKLIKRSSGIMIFASDNDQESVHTSVTILQKALLGIGYREFPGYGHFLSEDMKTTRFPELLEFILA